MRNLYVKKHVKHFQMVYILNIVINKIGVREMKKEYSESENDKVFTALQDKVKGIVEGNFKNQQLKMSDTIEKNINAINDIIHSDGGLVRTHLNRQKGNDKYDNTKKINLTEESYLQQMVYLKMCLYVETVALQDELEAKPGEKNAFEIPTIANLKHAKENYGNDIVKYQQEFNDNKQRPSMGARILRLLGLGEEKKRVKDVVKALKNSRGDLAKSTEAISKLIEFNREGCPISTAATKYEAVRSEAVISTGLIKPKTQSNINNRSLMMIKSNDVFITTEDKERSKLNNQPRELRM